MPNPALVTPAILSPALFAPSDPFVGQDGNSVGQPILAAAAFQAASSPTHPESSPA
jgi:hypothetical protein